MEVFQLSKNNFTVSSTYGDYIVRFESFSNFKQTIDFDKFFFIIDDDLKTLYSIGTTRQEIQNIFQRLQNITLLQDHL